MMRFLTPVLLLPVLLQTGCASFNPDGSQRAGPGQATYRYTKGADGSCEVVITSAREVPGLEAKVSKDCAVTVKAEALTGVEAQTQMLQLFQQAFLLGR